MLQFGVWFDADSFFVGRKPGRWVGIHIDHWWTEDVKAYGAPLASYLHWWPGKCWRWNWPRTKKAQAREEARFKAMWSGPVFRTGGMRPRCTVQGCTWYDGNDEKVDAFYVLRSKLHFLGGVENDLGSRHMVLCPPHVKVAKSLRIEVSEQPEYDEGPWVTKTGKVLTDADLEALADEAETPEFVERTVARLKGESSGTSSV